MTRDRQIHSEAFGRLQRSRKIVADLLKHRIFVAIDSDNLRIGAGPAEPNREPEKISKTQVEPWIEAVVNQYQQLLAANDRAEEFAKSLKATREAVAERYPEKAGDLRNEQAIETKPLNERLLHHHPGIGGMGM